MERRLVIRDCMKKNVVSIQGTASIRDAVAMIVSHHIGLLPIVDPEEHPIGVIGLRDFLNLALPSTFDLLTDIDFIGDFGALERYLPEEKILSRMITELMRPGTVVREDSGLVRAYSFMLQHDLHDLPVVDQTGRLSGIASRVDIGTAILANWV